jgi:hypothetical protein
MGQGTRLSAKSAAILGLIASGHSYGQIVDGHPDVSYLDIFAAAEEALGLGESPTQYEERMRQIRERYPNAYRPWTDELDRELTRRASEGADTRSLSAVFGRQPSAIRSRLTRLGIEPRRRAVEE